MKGKLDDLVRSSPPKIGDPVPGLNNAKYGPPLTSNSSPQDIEYATRVTGNNTGLSPYVNEVEFDGIEGKTLLEAKNANKGGYYDVTKTDSFTRNIAIPKILEQAQRQINALRDSGATGIEWRVANSTVADGLQALFKEKGLDAYIFVKYVP